MALESPVTYISDLVATNPATGDDVAVGDDHIRNIKTALLNTFPNVTSAVTATHTALNGGAMTRTGDQTMQANLVFSGNARRIIGDFSGSTVANRVLFQNSGGVNDETAVGVLPPSGSRIAVLYALENPADIANSGLFSCGINQGEGYAFVRSFRLGTGTNLPLAFFTDDGTPAERFRLTIDGKMDFADGMRIRGDFSNATAATRVLFQTDTTNSGGTVGCIPNGSGDGAGWTAFAASDPDNSEYFQFTSSSTAAIINSSYIGSATTQEIQIQIESTPAVTVGTDLTTTFNTDEIVIASAQTPASATAAGVAGTICWSSTHVYVCVATNTWKRAALSTW